MSLTTTVGSIVEFDPQWLRPAEVKTLAGRPHRIVKVNPRTIKVENEMGQTITTDPFMVQPSNKPFNKSDAERPVLGSIVRVDRLPEGLYVVVDAKIAGCRVAKLGGNENRYYRNIPLDRITVVPAAEVLK